ncbi:MAG: RelA/SpoT family protein [Pseudomonadota bacterium]|nr:RelA/SpoT family protein [Pseudomonadota bacterium]
MLLKSYPSLKNQLSYLPESELATISRALALASKAHKGQKRKTGEPYIIHPVAVAEIIANLKLDSRCISAALLHDVIEDSQYKHSDLQKQFGDEVANLVEGVTKIQKMPTRTRKESQAENFRKMLMAMCKDIRVLIIKLADRLHNMETIAIMPRDNQVRIATETLDIYAPLARRLGINTLAASLESLGFEVLHPKRSAVVKNAIDTLQGCNKMVLEELVVGIKEKLTECGVQFNCVKGRGKHAYSTYKKMRDKKISFAEITDMFAIRICVKSREDCYRALGVMHELFRPLHNTFKDYIALPKANGYQSLHTILFGPNTAKIEAQIRTYDMDKIADSGVAAHCLYKAKEKNISVQHIQAQEYLGRIMALQKHVGTTLEFMEHVKIDLCPDEIYVFTPQGDIIELPIGACVLDFAYAIHTDMGNKCLTAKVDQQIRHLSTMLQNGQTVTVTTHESVTPNDLWLEWVRTAKAKSAIRYILRTKRKEDILKLGKKLLGRYVEEQGYGLEDVSSAIIKEVVFNAKLADVDGLYEAIALGRLSTKKVFAQIAALMKRVATDELIVKSARVNPALVISNDEHHAMSYACCCYPIPGDDVIGLLEEDKGVVIHRKACSVGLKNRDIYQNIAVIWGRGLDKVFQTSLLLELTNERGALAAVSIIIANEGADVQDLDLRYIDINMASLRLIVTISSQIQLRRITKALQREVRVHSVKRVQEYDLA